MAKDKEMGWVDIRARFRLSQKTIRYLIVAAVILMVRLAGQYTALQELIPQLVQ